MNLNIRETATVLAALRYWQREGLMSGGYEHDIASNNDTEEPLAEGEIESLCERLNMGPDPEEDDSVWVLFTDTHNGAQDFEAFRMEEAAEKAFVQSFNAIFGREETSFEAAHDAYEIENEKPFNEDWMRLEKVVLK
jgi:hypothetical protein